VSTKINKSMKLLIAIGLGSFIGGTFRYLLSLVIQAKTMTVFPYGTLAVNVVGCLLIGIVFGIADKGYMSTEWKLFLATGLLGGFTTFSALSLETFSMIRMGHHFYAGIYVTSSILIGLLATIVGVLMVRMF
jgi:fluoride exporter